MNANSLSKWPRYWVKIKTRLALLLSEPAFWCILLIKLFAGSLFASDYLARLFIPFLDYFQLHPFESPYGHFWFQDETRAFPYPAFMLYCMSLPRMLVQLIFPSVADYPTLLLLLYRLPLLACDFLIAAVLTYWMQDKIRLVIWLYWASPVLFYITYLHGQLDVIPIAFLFISLFALFKDRIVFAALLFGLGVATKTNLVIAMPFFVIYLWQKESFIKPPLTFLIITAAVFIGVNLPFFTDPGFIGMVFHNAEQQKLLRAALTLSTGIEFYLIPAVYLLLLCKASQMTLQNRHLFLMFLGFSFGLLLIFIPPKPGWYFWIIPLWVYFYMRAPRGQLALFILLQASYLLYFLLDPESDYLTIWQYAMPALAEHPNLYQTLLAQGVDANVLHNLAFTLMQSVLIVNCIWIYRNSIMALQRHKLTSRSFLLGISGDSGSGKSTLAETLRSLFTARNTLAICGDDMHKWQRNHDKWQELTHLDPKANQLHQEVHYISALRKNQIIGRRHYDHATGNFTEEQTIKPKPLIILEGLHSLYLKSTREMMDLKLFLRPDADLLLHRKIMRDMQKRNYTKEKALESIKRRAHDAESYIRIQEANADFIISFKLKAPIADIGITPEPPLVWLEITLSNKFYIDPLIEDLSKRLQNAMKHYYSADDQQVIEFHASLPSSGIEDLGQKHVKGLQELGIYEPYWQGGWEGLLQLLIAYCIFHESANDLNA